MNSKLINITNNVLYRSPIKIVRPVYCELGFLQQIQPILEKPTTVLDRNIIDSQLEILISLLVDFDLYVDMPDKDVALLSSNGLNFELNGVKKILHKIAIKKASSGKSVCLRGQSKYVSVMQLSKDQAQSSFNAIYLTSADAETCKQAENDYGIIAIRYDEKNGKFTHSNFFQPSLLNSQIKRGESAHKWQFMTNMNLKSNSLVWVDGYILKDESTIKYNVKPILDKLLPTRLRIPYIITFVTNYPPQKDKKETATTVEKDSHTSSLKEIKETIVQIIHELRGEDYNFKVNVCNMNKYEHDRCILTNNQYITSGAGFDLIRKTKNGQSIYTKSTNVYGSCIYSNGEDRRNYENLCKRLAGIRKDGYEWIDDSQSRLF